MPEQLCQRFSGSCRLFLAHGHWLVDRERPRECLRKIFGGFPAGSKDQQRSKIGQQRSRNKPRPISTERAGSLHREIIEHYLLETHWTLLVRDKFDLSAQAPKPLDHVLRIRHTPAQEQDLGLRRRKRQNQLIVRPSNRIGQELVLVDHKQPWTFPS